MRGFAAHRRRRVVAIEWPFTGELQAGWPVQAHHQSTDLLFEVGADQFDQRGLRAGRAATRDLRQNAQFRGFQRLRLELGAGQACHEQRVVGHHAAIVFSTLALATPLWAQGASNTSPAAVEPGTYAIEPNHTQIIFSVLHMGFSYYSGRLTDASGELTLDPKQPAASAVRISVPVSTISTTSAKLDGELKSADWLDAAKYPTVTFKSTTVTPGDKGEAKIMGDLTLHGVTKSVTLDARLVGSGINPLDKAYTVGFEISGDIKRSDFGVTKYVPLIGDAVHLSISGAFEKK